MSFVSDLNQAGGRVYEVGGTVRDRLLGLAHKDRDLLVTGLALDALLKLLRRGPQPVEQDLLHPEDKTAGRPLSLPEETIEGST